MDYLVSVTTVETQAIAAARQRTTYARVSQEIGKLLDGPWAFIRANPGLRTNGDNVAIYWDASGQGSIEVGVQVTRTFQETDAVVCSATPAGTVATTAYYGPYEKIGPAHIAIREWCLQNSHSYILPYWEVYGDWDEDPAKLRTDVYYLLK